MDTLTQDSLAWVHALVSPIYVNVRFRHQSRSEQKTKTNTQSSTIVLRSRIEERIKTNVSKWARRSCVRKWRLQFYRKTIRTAIKITSLNNNLQFSRVRKDTVLWRSDSTSCRKRSCVHTYATTRISPHLWRWWASDVA